MKACQRCGGTGLIDSLIFKVECPDCENGSTPSGWDFEAADWLSEDKSCLEFVVCPMVPNTGPGQALFIRDHSTSHMHFQMSSSQGPVVRCVGPYTPEAWLDDARYVKAAFIHFGGTAAEYETKTVAAGIHGRELILTRPTP